MNGTEQVGVALIRDVFFGDGASERLVSRLGEAKARGAALAVLPEIPCNPWSPATKIARDEDAEERGGPRWQMQADAARSIGIALVGGAIVRDESGTRRNTAIVFDSRGEVVGTYCKLHLPEEPGFWETSHYEPGVEWPSVFEVAGLRVGVQICSDINRPEGCHLLGAQGAEVIVAPRSTERVTFHRWRPVFIANSLTSGCYVMSVDRPMPEQGVEIGQPSFAVSPNAEVLIESSDAVTVATVDRRLVTECHRKYPGYLATRSRLYAEAWGTMPDRGAWPHAGTRAGGVGAQ
ncbi:MAG: carbon-nitrogen hydrolase family protein [Phycisphaeraceae bacterium]|nr:carbon-nitrogen hydrolase family protein [Phycisphaerales bacterium]MCB9842974.1 carbon-nitrogen hydrolase family protein [Phycisphaeraceae bacterium]